jgi:hypothetical protein
MPQQTRWLPPCKQVVLGTWHGAQVAIKLLHMSEGTDEASMAALQDLLHQASHPATQSKFCCCSLVSMLTLPRLTRNKLLYCSKYNRNKLLYCSILLLPVP